MSSTTKLHDLLIDTSLVSLWSKLLKSSVYLYEIEKRVFTMLLMRLCDFR